MTPKTSLSAASGKHQNILAPVSLVCGLLAWTLLPIVAALAAILTGHIAYAKVQEKLGNAKLVLQHLERAVALEPSIQSINILADSYDRNGQKEKAAAIRDKINRAMSRGQHVDRRVKQPAGAISPQ